MPPQTDDLGVSVRDALRSDAARIAALCVQLGYDVPPAHVELVLRDLGSDASVLVAVVPRAGVVGWLSIVRCSGLLAEVRAEIEGVVVEDEFRGHGIGEALVRSAEHWARRHDCSEIRLRTNVVRERAHEFYRRLGYDLVKTQHTFRKAI